MLDFIPTPQCPGLQYIEHVDPHSAADAAGLLAGDFITEVGSDCRDIYDRLTS